METLKTIAILIAIIIIIKLIFKLLKRDTSLWETLVILVVCILFLLIQIKL